MHPVVAEEVHVASIGVRHAYLHAGPAKLELLAFDKPRQSGEDRRLQVGVRHLGIVVEDVLSAHEQLAAAGISFAQGPTPGAGSARWKAVLLDPNGVEIKLIEH
jgi:extradiol dioxygenase family protein